MTTIGLPDAGVCSCSEGLLIGADDSMHRVPGHDCGYVKARNRCIPEAERRASARVPDRTKRSEWSAAFLAAMDEVCKERGVVT